MRRHARRPRRFHVKSARIVFVTSSTAEASCKRCVGLACVGTPHMGGVECIYIYSYCYTDYNCGYVPAARSQTLVVGRPDLEPGPILTPGAIRTARPVLTLAEAMDDREGDPTLRPTGACIPAPTDIATCSIANGQSSLVGCKTPWQSGSRVRQGAPAERDLAVSTAGP